MLCFSPECCGVVQNAVVWSRMLWCGPECCAVVGVIGNTLMIVRWRGGAGTQPDRIHATPPPCSATLVCAFVSHIVLCTKRKNAQRRAEDTQRTHKGHTSTHPCVCFTSFHTQAEVPSLLAAPATPSPSPTCPPPTCPPAPSKSLLPSFHLPPCLARTRWVS